MATLLAELDRATWGAVGYSIPESGDLSRRLLAWIRERLDDPAIGYALPPRRLAGGTDTHTYRFGLTNAPGGLGGPLVLRLYSRAHDVGRAVRESRIQKALARTPLPVPDVYLTCTDAAVLNGAFFIMQFLPGELMSRAAAEAIPVLLATTQLTLHGIDPAPIVEILRAQGEMVLPQPADEDLAAITAYALKYPTLGPIVGWMSENLPPPPVRLSLCHGDFHPLNIAVQDGEVTGVFDWANFMVGDPAADVAATMTLGIPARRLFSLDSCDRIWQEYLESYRSESPIDPDTLDYYRVRRCLIALLSGAGGRAMWKHAAIARDVIADLRARTGVALTAPPWESR